jgi:hypothetical protein
VTGRRITGSKLHRLWQCPASGVLPQNTNEDLDARTEPARGRGHVVHKYLERCRIDGVDAALSQVPADMLNMCRALDIDRLPTNLSTEVAFAWNWRDQTARELGRNLGHRDYDALGVDPSCEIPTTTDVTGYAEWTSKGAVELLKRGLVTDYKTGHTKYPRPARFGQILIAACCIRYLWALDDVNGEVIYIDDDGECYPQRDLIDGWTLDTFERELKALMEEQPALEALFLANGGGVLAKHEGPHCSHCPAFKDCSAKTALVRSMPEQLIRLGAERDKKTGDFLLVWTPKKNGKPDEGAWELQLAPGAITARNAAAVYEACERIESMCRRMRTEVCGIAYHEPVHLSDGRVIEKYVWRRRQVDGRIAAAVLEKKYGRDAVLKKLDISLSLEAIRDLVVEGIDWKVKPRPVIESRRGDGVLDKVLKEIEAAKGLATATGEECKPRKPRGKR